MNLLRSLKYSAGVLTKQLTGLDPSPPNLTKLWTALQGSVGFGVGYSLFTYDSVCCGIGETTSVGA